MRWRKPSKRKMYPVPNTNPLALHDSPSANLALSHGSWRRQRSTPTVDRPQVDQPYHACDNRTDPPVLRRACGLDDDAGGTRHG